MGMAGAGLEGLRASLADDGRRAAETWGTVDRELAKVLRQKQQPDPGSSPLPLQGNARMAPTGSCHSSPSRPGRRRAGSPCGSSEGEEAAASPEARASRVAAARNAAFEERARRMRMRADDSRLKAGTHAQRKLRAKVTEILLEVKRRQELEQAQERARQRREAYLQEHGRSSLLRVGEADRFALGLSASRAAPLEEKTMGPRHCEAARAAGVHPHVIADAPILSTKSSNTSASAPMPPAPRGPSPRRVAILDSLSMEELEMLRRNTLFYFEGSVPAALSNGASESSKELELMEARRALEPLADFFTPPREEREEPMATYVRKLREQLEAKEPQQALASTGRLDVSRAPEAWDPTERMPSQGRRQACRDDKKSPTFAKVREVYQRRDAAEAQWMSEREESVLRREAVNAFKVSEQQRELQLESSRQKELHRLRLREAEQRKAGIDAQQQERSQALVSNGARRRAFALLRAEASVEARRDKATDVLEAWEQGVLRCEQRLREQELATVREAEIRWGSYMGRLSALGSERQSRLDESSKGLLKNRIQSSLLAQKTGEREEEVRRMREASDAKQAAAAERRSRANKYTRYNLVDQAFGPQASLFDPKFAAAATDRRSESWRKSAEAWSKEHGAQRSSSEPALAAVP